MGYGSIPENLRKYYRLFILSKIISENSFHNENELLSYLDDNGYLDLFDNTNIVKYIDEISYFNGLYILEDKYLRILKSLSEVLDVNVSKSKTTLHKEIKSYLESNRERVMYYFDNEYLYQVSMYILDNRDLAEFSFFYVSIKFLEYSFKYESELFKMFDKNNTLKLIKISKNSYFSTILDLLEVERIDEIIKLPIGLIVPAFNVFSNDFLKLLRFNYYDYENEISLHLHYIIQSTKEKYMDILVKRNGWDIKKPMTLEELGEKYDITRERVRQLEKNAISNIVSKAKLMKQVIMEYCEYIFHSTRKNYISFDYISHLYGVKAGIILLIFEQLSSDKYKYLPNYQILIRKKDSIDKVFNEFAKKLPDILSKNDYESEVYDVLGIESDYIKRCLFTYTYKEQEGYYIKKGILLSQIILSILDEFFPNGYSISKKDHFQMFLKVIKNKYPVLKDVEISKRKISTSLYNHNYKTIDRGTYVNQDLMPDLSIDLVNRIKKTITEREVVYYQSLFELYKNELKGYGIKNKYHLKGALDDYLSYEYSVGRDAISTDENIKVKDKIINFIHENNGEVVKKEVIKTFKGISVSALNGLIYYSEDLIGLSEERIVETKKIYLSIESKRIIRKHHKALQNTYGVPAITASKLYSRILFLDKYFFDKNKYILNYRDLLSIVKISMNTEFYFKGTIISSDNDYLDENTIIKDFLETKKKFTKRELGGFLSEMHLRNPNSFQQFIIDISDIFVQIDLDVFAKKSIISLRSKTLEDVKNNIDFVLSNQPEINTSMFKGYFLFPQVPFKWNKHSLVGVVRSYFSQYYTIEYTDSQYQLTNYIIRRG